MRAFGKRGLVRNRQIPHFGESCGENQAFFLWAVSLKQEPTEVIQESCLAPERGRNPQPLGEGGCQLRISGLIQILLLRLIRFSQSLNSRERLS